MLQHIDNDNSLESLRELYEQDLAKPELDIIPEMCGCTHWHTRICQCVRALQGPCHRARCSKALHSLTRGTLVRSLVTPAELAIDNAKEDAWMEMYDHDSDMLEDILYLHLQDLWAQLTDSIKVFDANNTVQQLCAQKVWEALLTAFPLDHSLMQTALLARELARMMLWDGDSK